MANLLKIAAALGVVALTACGSAAPKAISTASHIRCDRRAANTMASNTGAVAAHRYAVASRNAETAARLWLSCGDPWRAANALIVAGELAHQNGNASHARALVHEGFTIMHTLRRTVKLNDVTSSLLADKLNSARRDMQGQWAYW